MNAVSRAWPNPQFNSQLSTRGMLFFKMFKNNNNIFVHHKIFLYIRTKGSLPGVAIALSRSFCKSKLVGVQVYNYCVKKVMFLIL